MRLGLWTDWAVSATTFHSLDPMPERWQAYNGRMKGCCVAFPVTENRLLERESDYALERS